MPDALLADLTARSEQMITDIGALVRCESPSGDHDALERSAEVIAELGAELLGRPARRVDVDGCPHLRWDLGPSEATDRVLVLAHHDTVWPLGTLARLPWSVEQGSDGPVLRGPGCFDMKAGLVQGMHAIAVAGEHLPVTLLVTGDEEIGSPSSRALIETAARGCCAALVLEASADGGALKSGRKGVGLYDIEVAGRAAHAGLEPHAGANAGVELATQILRVAALDDEAQGTSVTPTVMSAGSTSNTVPAIGRVAVDVRAWTDEALRAADAALRSGVPTVPGTTVTVRGGVNRPPLDPRGALGVLALARRLNADLGLGELSDVAVGGASDGNFTAGVGTPTLDGLGAVGGGAHADTEHVLAGWLPRRAALTAALIRELAG